LESLLGDLKERKEPKMEDRWLSVDEIGEYLGVKRDTIYKWISEKGMPAHKMGRLWKLKKTEVDQWVRNGGADSSDKNPENQ
jgi:excisionase family DNA binding protein